VAEGGAGQVTRDSMRKRLAECAKALLSFEALFLAYMFAGTYKASALFSLVPVDMTILMGLLSGLVGMRCMWQRWRRGEWPSRGALVVVGVGLLFFAMPSVSLLWTPGVLYARQKALYVLVLNTWGLVGAALIIGPEPRRLRRFVGLWCVWVLFLSSAYTLLGVPLGLGNNTRPGLFGSNYQTVGVSLGYGLSILLVVFWCWSLQWWHRVGLGVLILWMFWVLLENSSRMPLLGSLGVAVLPILIGFRSNGVRWARSWRGALTGAIVVAAAGGALVVYRSQVGGLPTGITRLANVPALIMGRNPDYRRLLWMKEAFRFWLQRPVLGHGCGAFPLLLGRSDARTYPHNIVMEVLCELGLVGISLLAWLHWAALRLVGGWRRLLRDRWRMMIVSLFLCTLATAMVSSDLHGNRPLFMMLGLCSYGATSLGQPERDPQSREVS